MISLVGILDPLISLTHIALISKKEQAKILNDFIPISPRNVSYKIISKNLTPHLHHILGKFISLISETQGTFIPSRHITDNIFIAKEFFHQMQQRCREKQIGALKVNIHKVYEDLGISSNHVFSLLVFIPLSLTYS